MLHSQQGEARFKEMQNELDGSNYFRRQINKQEKKNLSLSRMEDSVMYLG